jgi:acetylserotonin N-methyltransferase
MIKNRYALQTDPYPIYDTLMMPFATNALLVAIIELDLFNKLHNNPSTLSEICKMTKIRQRPAFALLHAFVALRFLKKIGEKYYLSPLSEEFFVRDKPFYMGDLISIYRYYPVSYEQFRDAVLTDEPQIYGRGDAWTVHKSDKEKASLFTGWMHIRSLINGASLVEEFDFSGYKKILDVGGGSGGISIMIAMKNQSIKATIFDIPSVCKIAERIISQFNISGRIDTISGNMFRDPFPSGADIVLFSRILHDWPLQDCEVLLKKSFDILPSKGAVIILESLTSRRVLSPLLENLSMLVWTKGKHFTAREIRSLLKKTGFVNVAIASIASHYNMIAAYKP